METLKENSWIAKVGTAGYLHQYRLIDIKIQDCLDFCVDDPARREFLEHLKQAMNDLVTQSKTILKPYYITRIDFDFKKNGKKRPVVITATQGYTWDTEKQAVVPMLSIERFKSSIKQTDIKRTK